MRAILFWTNGIEVSTKIFSDTNENTGTELAVEEMERQFDSQGKFDENLGAYKGTFDCRFMADGCDTYVWHVEEIPLTNAEIEGLKAYSPHKGYPKAEVIDNVRKNNLGL